MPNDSDLRGEEYRALRATIRERGSVRLIVSLITFVSWAALVFVVLATTVVPVLGLIPLLVLAAGFEVVFAAHVGVERIGRYLQARYESPEGLPAWEQTAMRLGQAGLPGGGIDPLFSALFTAAGLMNLVPIALLSSAGGPAVAGVPLELLVYAILHFLFVARVVAARRFAATQRVRELPLFETDTRPR